MDLCKNISQDERNFLKRADSDGRVFSDNNDRGVVLELLRKGYIEQNIYRGSCYFVRCKVPEPSK